MEGVSQQECYLCNEVTQLYEVWVKEVCDVKDCEEYLLGLLDKVAKGSLGASAIKLMYKKEGRS